MRTRQPESHAGALERRERSGLPADLAGLAWEDLDPGPHVDAALGWSEGEPRGLLLEGPVGVGKTRLAATAAWQFLARRTLRWSSMPLLHAQLSSPFGSAAHVQALALLTRTDALVLDDLDKARPTDYVAQCVFLAIDTRLNAGASLAITTNRALYELATFYPPPWGETIASRLAGCCERFVLRGDDRRLRR